MTGCGGSSGSSESSTDVSGTVPVTTAPAATTSTQTVTASEAPGPIPFLAEAAALPDPLPEGSVHVPILMFHRVADPKFARSAVERSLTVAPYVFAQQLNWLRGHGYTTITQEALFAAIAHDGPLPAHPVMLTFDDGYIDISKTVLPLVERRHMVATAYVIASRVTGPDRAFMKMAALRKIEAGGIEVGSHSVSHSDMPSLSDAAALRELTDSRRLLERGLGHPMQWFCYPAGRYDARVEALAREAGYLLATTTEPGSDHDRTRPLALSRVRISNSTGVGGLASALGS